MGGLALKGLPKDKETRRYMANEFNQLAKELLPKIELLFNTKVSLVESYHDKESHGDMDILVYDTGFNPEEIKKSLYDFGATLVVRTPNSRVYSFDYKNLQIDLIFTPDEDWETSKVFFNWGDLGNLMGKLFNNYGGLADHGFLLKYGYDGAKVKLVYKGRKKIVYLTKYPDKVFDFLGLDFTLHSKGFNNQYDMYDYVIESKYFDYGCFQWKNLSSVNKQRNKRRPAFIEFLEYIKKYKNKNQDWSESKSYYLNEIKNYFGVDLLKEYQYLVQDVELQSKVRDKFNGKTILDNFKSVKPKQLNNLISNFNKYIIENEGDYRSYILENDVSDILKLFKEVNNL